MSGLRGLKERLRQSRPAPASDDEEALGPRGLLPNANAGESGDSQDAAESADSQRHSPCKRALSPSPSGEIASETKSRVLMMVDRLRRSTSDPGDPPPALASTPQLQLSGAKWWGQAMLDAVATVWASRFARGLARPLVLHEGAAGMGSAHHACQVLGIPLATSGVVSERKQHARVVLCGTLPKACHITSTLKEHAQGHGFCHQHGCPCAWHDEPRCDVLVSGPPCQPFTQQRADYFQTGSANHCAYTTTLGGPQDLDSVFNVVSQTLPRCFLFENVLNILRTDPASGQLPLVRLVELLQSIRDKDGKPHFVATHVFQMDPGMWLAISRPRLSGNKKLPYSRGLTSEKRFGFFCLSNPL